MFKKYRLNFSFEEYNIKPTLLVKDSFKYIPLAVLTPIIVNDLSIIENKNFFLIENFKLYAALIAIIVSIIWNNVLATISIGMASFLILSNI